MAILTTASLALVAALQAQGIQLPAPTGPHTVGSVSRVWADTTRLDTIGGSRGAREVLIRAWYPASDTNARRAVYAENADRSDSAYAALHAAVRNHARLDAAVSRAPAQFPVIVLAPGRSGGVYDHTTLAEDLASHGYVVLGVSSPHHSRIIRQDGTLMPVLFGAVGPALYPHGIDAAQEPMNQLVSGDLLFVLKQLPGMHASDARLRGRLDLSAVGLIGHSNGAMAGSRACVQEVACRAFLGIEGQPTQEIRRGGNEKPVMQVYSAQTLSFDTARVFTELRLRARAPYTLIEVDGAAHNTFTDLPLVRPGAFAQRIDARRGLVITRAIVNAFFDQHLRGQSQPEGALREFPELRVSRFP